MADQSLADMLMNAPSSFWATMGDRGRDMAAMTPADQARAFGHTAMLAPAGFGPGAVMMTAMMRRAATPAPMPLPTREAADALRLGGGYPLDLTKRGILNHYGAQRGQAVASHMDTQLAEAARWLEVAKGDADIAKAGLLRSGRDDLIPAVNHITAQQSAGRVGDMTTYDPVAMMATKPQGK